MKISPFCFVSTCPCEGQSECVWYVCRLKLIILVWVAGESYFGTPLFKLVSARAWWLISLLMLQSLSSVILTKFSGLIEVRGPPPSMTQVFSPPSPSFPPYIGVSMLLSWLWLDAMGVQQKHLVIALFLTMLTGTAGNAGNQSSAMVIRGLATGEIHRGNGRKVIWRELKVRQDSTRQKGWSGRNPIECSCLFD